MNGITGDSIESNQRFANAVRFVIRHSSFKGESKVEGRRSKVEERESKTADPRSKIGSTCGSSTQPEGCGSVLSVLRFALARFFTLHSSLFTLRSPTLSLSHFPTFLTRSLTVAALFCLRASVVLAQSGATPSPQQVVESARKATAYLWGLVILFLVVLMGLYILRMLRRAKHRLLRESSSPTEYTDAWSMHRAPVDLLEPRDDDDAEA